MFASLRNLLGGGSGEECNSAEKPNNINVKKPDGTYEFVKETPIKIVVLGSSKVGKSAIITRFTMDLFASKYETTIGIEKSFIRLAHNTGLPGLCDIVNITFWDIAQPEVNGKHLQSVFEGVDGIIFVVDVHDIKSVAAIDQWMLAMGNYCDSKVSKWLFANKTEMSSSKAIPLSTLNQLVATNGFTCLEKVSAKSGKGVAMGIHNMMDEILSRKSATAQKSQKFKRRILPRYELEVDEAYTKHIERAQHPIENDTVSPLAESIEGAPYQVDVNMRTNEVLKELVYQVKKLENPSAFKPVNRESSNLLEKIHKFYQKLEQDLLVITQKGVNSFFSNDLEKLGLQRSSEYLSWQNKLGTGEILERMDILTSSFNDTIEKWDRLVETFSISLKIDLLDSDYQFGFVERKKLPGQSFISPSSSYAERTTQRSMGFSFRNAGRASPARSVATTPKSSGSSPISSYVGIFDQTLLAALAQPNSPPLE